MADRRITDVDFVDSLANNESFFVNQNNAIKQINKGDIIFGVNNGGTGATTANEARVNLGAIAMRSGSITIAKGDWYLGDDELYHYDDDNVPNIPSECVVFVNPANTHSFNTWVKYGIRCEHQAFEALYFVANIDPNESDDIIVNYVVFA